MWRRKRRPIVGFMQSEGNYGTEEKKSIWIFSHQLPAPLRVSGLQVSLPFAVSSGTRYWRRDGGKGAWWDHCVPQ